MRSNGSSGNIAGSITPVIPASPGLAPANTNIMFLREKNKIEKMTGRFPSHLSGETRSFIVYAKASHTQVKLMIKERCQKKRP